MMKIVPHLQKNFITFELISLSVYLITLQTNIKYKCTLQQKL